MTIQRASPPEQVDIGAGRGGLEVQEGAVCFELLMHRPQAAACHARLWAFFVDASRACGAAVPPWEHELDDMCPVDFHADRQMDIGR